MIETTDTAKRAWRERRIALVRRALAPPPKQTITEWAERHRRLARANNSESGVWRTERAPYLREVMDAMSNPDIEEVVFIKPVQIGFTDGVIGNTIGYHIDHDPCPMMVVQPTIDDAEKWSKEKLQPMLDETPRLRARVSRKGRDSANTILSKSGPGWTLRAVGTNSPRMLRQSSVRIVLFDEVDAYPPSSGEEGDVIALGKKRAMTFGNRKYLIGSTPTTKELSRIDKLYELSDQRHLYVPCPHCGCFQIIYWRNIKWDKAEDGTDLPESTYLMCDKEQGGCAAVIEERHKDRMVQAHEWRAHFPGRRVCGFRMNAFYSLFPGARWENLVREFLESKGHREQLQVWTNTVLGESFEDDGERVEVSGLAKTLEPFTLRPGTDAEYIVPAWCVVLTAAIDTQGDRLEYAVYGWGQGFECCLVETDFVPGDPGGDAVWREVDRRISHAFLHESGAALRVASVFVDSGGHHSAQVYAFTKARRNRNVFAIKGSSIDTAPILSKPSRVSNAKVTIFSIGTHAAKERIMSMLKRKRERGERGPGMVHLGDWLDTEHLEQLTSEKIITRYRFGRPTRVWVKIRDRNEQLDLFVYAMAAFMYLRLDDAALAQLLEAITARAQPLAPAPAAGGLAQLLAPPARRGFVTGWK